MTEWQYKSAAEIATQVRQCEVSPVEITECFLERIDRRNDELNAYVAVGKDKARERAKALERTAERGGRLGPLAGVPIALKDLDAFKKGLPQMFGSVAFQDNIADFDSTFVERLEDAGAVILGTTNTPEFGHKGTTDNHLFGATKNPFNLDRNAGGSSGGSAAAVADGLATLAHGGDAGGSLRIPASFCGVYTIKPTFRRVASVDRPNGFGAANGNFVHHGPIARSVRDAALMLDVMSGPHPRDPLSLPDDGIDYLQATDDSIDGYKIAYTPDFGIFPVEKQVRTAAENAVSVFVEEGATVEPIEVEIGKSHRELTEVWLSLTAVSFATMNGNLQRDYGVNLLEDHQDDLADEVIQLIRDGQDVTASEYIRMQRHQTDVFDAIEDVFEDYDLLVSPTLACLPVENAERGQTLGPTEIEGVPVDPTIGWCMTYLLNFTGHPAASLPGEFTDSGLPVGLQIAGPRFAEDDILAASAAFERARPWMEAYPRR
ncbi:amidase [Haladaptatus caseinilyticus]|uniref:amidase n=1 Tax=Haladaptatus caseinilyticus TaxID=2993314 RepID=UPI00224B01CC|nr:amidase [Haladaptatus caseinilyticus]